MAYSGEMDGVEGKTIGIVGLAFKNNTDDVREAPSMTILNELAARGANLKGYDPKAMLKATARLEKLQVSVEEYCGDEYETCKNADAIALMTKFNQFQSFDFTKVKAEMKGDHFFDFKNVYNKDQMCPHGFRYYSIGRA